MKKYKTEFSKEELSAALHANDNEATAIIEDENKWADFKVKFDAFLKKAEKIPVLGGMIDDIVCMVELVDSYVKKEYRDIPVSTIVSIVAALIYLLSPIDIIPDAIPFVGYLDDAAVVLLVLNLGVGRDLDKYRAWKEEIRKSALAEFEVVFASQLAEEIAERFLAGVILCDDKIKLLITDEATAEIPFECNVKQLNVPKKALESYDVEEPKDIVDILTETCLLEGINWAMDAEKKAYLEPDFEDKWDDYIIQEES